MCKNLEIVNIKCTSCRGSGETMYNDFSGDYVTEYLDTCFQCGGKGNIDVAEKVVIYCENCGDKNLVENFCPAEWISEEDKISIQNNGYMERQCQNCNETIFDGNGEDQE
jgi:DNA-directed RNA polymerase subunit RPC12/RpoP